MQAARQHQKPCICGAEPVNTAISWHSRICLAGILPETGTPLDGRQGPPSLRWLALVYEAAFAIRHHCSSMDSSDFMAAHAPFQRFIYPITPPQERQAISLLSTAD